MVTSFVKWLTRFLKKKKKPIRTQGQYMLDTIPKGLFRYEQYNMEVTEFSYLNVSRVS